MKDNVKHMASIGKDSDVPAGLAIVAIIFVAADLRPGIVAVSQFYRQFERHFDFHTEALRF